MAASLSSTFSLTLQGDREVVITRLFNAPKELVFKAMSSCEHWKKWLGPRYLTMSSCVLDFRAGGSYRYVLQAPDGSEYAFRGEIREVSPPDRVVQTFEWEGMPGHISVETLTLEEINGQTKLTVVGQSATPEDRDGLVGSGMADGAKESYDRLEEYLEILA